MAQNQTTQTSKLVGPGLSLSYITLLFTVMVTLQNRDIEVWANITGLQGTSGEKELTKDDE
jgi:hypothetical protein